MPTNPLISIITVTYNAETTVGRTIGSIDSQTGCTPGIDFEHIIMDGASSDSTLSIIDKHPRDYRIVISEPDKGIYDAMNKAMDIAKGSYLMFLNAGDTLHANNTLSTIIEAITSNNMPGIVYGQTDIVDNSGKHLGPRHLTAPARLTYKSFKQGMTVCHQAFIALSRIAPRYDIRYRFSADFDWCIQCLQHSRKNIYVPSTLIDYLSEGTTTANRFKSLNERYRIMCYYYGFWPTTIRHLHFLIRFASKRLKNKPV